MRNRALATVRRGFGAFGRGVASVPTRTRTVVRNVPVYVRRHAKGTAIGVGKTVVHAGGGAVAALAYDLVPATVSPLGKAAVLGGAALLSAAVPGLRNFAPGMAGAAGFVAVQALRKK